MHSFYSLGAGITINEEFALDESILIRPYKIEYDDIQLKRHTRNKVEFGFICALSDIISFEMETQAKTQKEAAMRAWNNQYALIFLSILIRKPVDCLLYRMPALKDEEEQLTLIHNHFPNKIFNERHDLTKTELNKWQNKFSNFDFCTENKNFVRAAAIAATHFKEPRARVIPPNLDGVCSRQF